MKIIKIYPIGKYLTQETNRQDPLIFKASSKMPYPIIKHVKSY